MQRIAQWLGIIFFLVIMGWGLWVTVWSQQISGENVGNLPALPSPIMSNWMILAIPFVAIGIAMLQLFSKLFQFSAKPAQQAERSFSAKDSDEDDATSHIGDDAIAQAAARYRAGLETQVPHAQIQPPRKPSSSPPSFGRRT